MHKISVHCKLGFQVCMGTVLQRFSSFHQILQDVCADFVSAEAEWVARKRVGKLWPVWNGFCRLTWQKMIVGTKVMFGVTAINKWGSSG